MGDREFLVGIVRRFRENSVGFFRAYRWFIAVFIISLLCDAVSTVRFMVRDGADGEFHFVIRMLAGFFGPVVGPFVGAAGKAVVGIGVAILLRRYAVYIFVAASLVSLWAGWYNEWGSGIYAPVIFQFLLW